MTRHRASARSSNEEAAEATRRAGGG